MEFCIKTVAELCTKITDGSHFSPEDEIDGQYEMFSVKDMEYNNFNKDNCKHIGEMMFSKLAKSDCRPLKDDVLIAKDGSYLKYVFKCNEDLDACILSSIAILRVNKKVINPDYMVYVMRTSSMRNAMASYVSGSALPRIILSDFKKMKLKMVEDLEQQGKIADILLKYDELIENNNRRIKILEQMAEEIYKEWFVRFRFPGYETCKFENGIPKERESVNLKSVLSKITTGLNPRKNFVLGEGENYYVTIKNMGDNNIYLDDKCDKVDDEAIKKINKRSDLKIGDILFSGIGTIGRVYLISIPTHNWNVSESVFTMRSNDKVSKEYLYMLLLSDDLQNFCSSHAQGVAQPGIRMAELESYKFRLPTKNIIDSFTNYISPIINTIQNLGKQNDILTKQRDFLLPRLMSGKLEVK